MILKSLEGLLFLTYLTKYNIGHIYELLSVHDTLESLLSNLPEGKLKITNTELSKAKINAKLAIEKLKYFNIKTCTIYEENYPIQFKNIKNPPPVIYFKGVFKTNGKLVAIVGSRKISVDGEKKTRLISKELVNMGYGIVSGLAHGVDGFAHHETIINKGYTIAVLPNSLDSIYPKEHWRLANSIIDNGGALISELAFLINRGKKSFVERNRLQAGLSEIIIPAEMRISSGTMHTINFGLSQKKTICLPDFIDDFKENNGIKHLVEKSLKNQDKRFLIFNSIKELTSGLGKNKDLEENESK